jgi:drug/metabolite transporter (DMT)-like permease
LGGGKLQFSPGQAAGVGFALAAAFLFALGTVTLRPIAEMGPLSIVAWQLAFGSLPMIVMGLTFEAWTTAALSAKGCLIWLYMTAVPTGLCYLTWFSALRRLPPATASMATLLTPVIGVLSASLLLSEPFTGQEAVALLLTIGGVGLSLWKKST